MMSKKGNKPIKSNNIKKGNKISSKPIAYKKHAESDDEEYGNSKKDDKKKKGKDNKQEDNSNPKKGAQNSTKENDKRLMNAFLNALYLAIDENDLPIEQNNLWTSYIYPCREPEFPLEIKDTSYQKLAKFLNYCQKADLIEITETNKKTKGLALSKINKNCPLFEDFEPTISKPNFDEENEEGNGKGGKNSNDSKIEATKQIENVYKPNNLLRSLLAI